MLIEKDLEKILFIAEGQIGDLLLLTPAIRAVKNSLISQIDILIIQRRGLNPPGEINCESILLSGTDNILTANPNLNNIIVVDHSLLKKINGIKRFDIEIRIIKFLRSKNYDKIICTFPNDRFVIWAFLSGAKIRVGQNNQALDFLLTDKLNLQKEKTGVLKYYLKLVELIGAKETSEETEFYFYEESLEFARDFLRDKNVKEKNFICIHPGASGNYKIWPEENFAELIKYFSSEGIPVVLCEGESDKKIIDKIIELCGSDFILFNSDKNIKKLAALFSLCGLVITNDSGPRHLAAAIKARSLAVFRKFHDKAWKVYPEDNITATIKSAEICPVCPDNICMDKIPEGEMFGSYCMRLIPVEKVKTRAMELFNDS